MKIKSLIIMVLGLIFVVWSCKDEPTYKGNHDPEVIKTYKNRSTSAAKMDSLASVGFITKQKLIELYELSSLYSSNQGDSLMREILYPQIQSYFLPKDTLNFYQILKEMDSLKVHYVELGKLDFPESDSLVADSVRHVHYSLKYYSKDKKFIDSVQKSAEFILKKEPKKFKHEFTFYFQNLTDHQVLKDTISSGVTQ
jgi:hypothetical protein